MLHHQLIVYRFRVEEKDKFNQPAAASASLATDTEQIVISCKTIVDRILDSVLHFNLSA